MSQLVWKRIKFQSEYYGQLCRYTSEAGTIQPYTHGWRSPDGWRFVASEGVTFPTGSGYCGSTLSDAKASIQRHWDNYLRTLDPRGIVRDALVYFGDPNNSNYRKHENAVSRAALQQILDAGIEPSEELRAALSSWVQTIGLKPATEARQQPNQDGGVR